MSNIDEVVDMLKRIHDNLIRRFDQDYVMVVTGCEGSGKSLLSFFLAQEINRGLSIDQICFTGKEYLEFQAKCIDSEVEKGSVIVFDEGGTQMLSRKAMDVENIELTSVFIANRFLNLVHIINVPKLKYLDIYVREERLQLMLYTWYDVIGDYERLRRRCAVITKPTLMKILESNRRWYTGAHNRWIRYADVIFDIPDLRERIPQDLMMAYLQKKKIFCKDLISDAIKSLNKKSTRELWE